MSQNDVTSGRRPATHPENTDPGDIDPQGAGATLAGWRRILGSPRSRRTIFLFVLAGCLALVLARYAITGSTVSGEGVYNFLVARSLVVDHDLDLADEYKYYSGQASPYTGGPKLGAKPQPNPVTGRYFSPFTLGAPILLSPFLALAHLLIKLFDFIGIASWSAQGYGPLYQLLGGAGSVVLGFLGVELSRRFTAKFYPEAEAAAGGLLVWLATPLVYYMTMQPFYSQTASMLAVAVYLWYWQKTLEGRTVPQWFIWGLLAGACTVVRYQNGLFALAAVADALRLRLDERRKWGRRHPEVLDGPVWFFLGMLMVVTPQLMVQKYWLGSHMATAYGEGVFTFWSWPTLLDTLFSADHGLLLWSPIIIPALIGLNYLRKKQPYTGTVLIVVLAAQILLVSSFKVPGRADSFGNGQLVNCGLIFVAGLAAFLEELRRRSGGASLGLWLGLAAIAANGAAVGLYCFGVIGHLY